MDQLINRAKEDGYLTKFWKMICLKTSSSLTKTYVLIDKFSEI